MSIHLTTFEGSVTDAIRTAITGAIPGAEVDVSGGGGHFTITVRSPVFAEKPKIQRHRLVLGAIKHLMQGEAAPVHAVDRLETVAPGEAA